MILNWLFFGVLAGTSILYLCWGFRVLPRERFQFLAVIPIRKLEDGSWQSLNLTYYGLLTAMAVGGGLLVFLILSAGTGAPLDSSLIFLTTILVISLPAAGLFSRWVEGKRHTFTTQGAFWAGGAASVPVLYALAALPESLSIEPLPVLPTLAALATAYCLAEGWGRLACISFGCCYGRPLAECPSWVQRLFKNHCFVFHGGTKKIAYAQGWERVPMFPVQGVTAGVHVLGGSAALGLYLVSHFVAAFWVAMAVSQGWRFYSEFLRRDHRGGGRLTIYQKGALVAVAYSVFLGWVLPAAELPVHIAGAVASILNLKPLLWMMMFGIITFLYMGRSQVTEAQVTFRVREDRI